MAKWRKPIELMLTPKVQKWLPYKKIDYVNRFEQKAASHFNRKLDRLSNNDRRNSSLGATERQKVFKWVKRLNFTSKSEQNRVERFTNPRLPIESTKINFREKTRQVRGK